MRGAAHHANPAGGYKCIHKKVSGTTQDAKRRRRVPVVTI